MERYGATPLGIAVLVGIVLLLILFGEAGFALVAVLVGVGALLGAVGEGFTRR